MKNNNKLTYETPTLGVIHIEMEQGIAAGSAAINSGSNVGAPHTPKVEDWKVEPPISSGFDI